MRSQVYRSLLQPAAVVAAASWFFACGASQLRADTVFFGNLSLENASIQGIAQGQLLFNTSSGNSTQRDLSKIIRIHVDGENAFNDADDAYASGNFAGAVDGYLTTSRSTTKDWLKQYIAGRLVDAANKSNRFDAAVTAYVGMVLKDPAAAAHVRPKMPAADSTYLDTAISQVVEALGTSAKLTDDQSVVLLQFEVDLYNTKKDAAGADKAEAQLDDILAKDPNNPAAQQANARRKLQAAQVALVAKKYQESISDIDANKQMFTDPQQQADALFTVAEARMGLASDAKDPAALKDAALAYMRVVADFKDLPAKPHVADSLLKTGQIEEQLAEPDVAAHVYQQVADQFPSDPAAQQAKQNLYRLKTITK